MAKNKTINAGSPGTQITTMKNKISSLFVAVCLGLPLIATSFTGCAGDRYNRSTGEYLDDKGLNMRVKSALSDNPEYKFGDVKVTSFRGTVQLAGFVNTAAQKSEAAKIARGVQGAKDVENNITVKE
jgi:osmotically-inducible protein OsmY